MQNGDEADMVGTGQDGPATVGGADQPDGKRSSWLTLAALNLLLGIIGLCFECTSYVIVNSIAEVLFAPAVALFGLISVVTLRTAPHRFRRLAQLACVPSLIVGLRGAAVVASLFLPLPFGIFELLGESEIQRSYSPDGWRVAIVRFRPVGGYSEGNGRVSVDVASTWFPLIARHEFYLADTVKATEKPLEYVRWLDANVLFITEQRLTLSAAEATKWYPPLVVQFAITGFDWLLPPTDPAAATLLATIPDATGSIGDRGQGVVRSPWMAYRTYALRGAPGVAGTFNWYRTELAASDWSITRVSEQHDEESTNPRLRFCLRLERDTETGEHQTVYISVLGRRRGTTFVNVTTPVSRNGACRAGYDIVNG